MDVQATLTALLDGQQELLLAVSDLSRRLTTVENNMSNKDELQELRAYTEAGFDTMSNRFDDVEGRLDGLDCRIDRLEDGQDRILSVIDPGKYLH